MCSVCGVGVGRTGSRTSGILEFWLFQDVGHRPDLTPPLTTSYLVSSPELGLD